MTLPIPDFITRDPEAVVAHMVAQFEADSGKTLYPAQPERLLVNQIAYRESLLREAIQDAALQNLVAFARAPQLDYLGQLLGVARLGAAPATTVLRFTFPSAFGVSVFLPAGIRCATANGLIVFATDSIVQLSAGSTIIDVPATCETVGMAGNGWQPSQVANLLDDIGVVGVVVTNQQASASGADAEDDDHLRVRIQLAPEAFTTAGSRGAYRFHAISAHQSITDVAVTSPGPGNVSLYVMTGADVPSSGFLAAVAAACSDERVRPLCDTVIVLARLTQSYALNVSLTLITGSVATDLLANVTATLTAYSAERSAGLGRDIVLDRIKTVCMLVDGVYAVDISSPSANLAIDDTTLAVCSGITVSIGGYQNG